MRKRGDPQKAIAYLRVSTELEAQDAGLPSQRERCARWAADHGVTIAGEHQDRISGSVPADERPGLVAAVREMRDQGAGLLLVANRARAFRADAVDVAICERIVRDAGGMIVSADGISAEDTPEGELVRGMFDVFARYERARIRFRMKLAFQKKREAGEYTGGQAPFGWRVEDGRLHEDAKEQAVIRRIRSLRGEGMGAPRIARWLTKHGVPCRGNGWHQKTVQRILARETRT